MINCDECSGKMELVLAAESIELFRCWRCGNLTFKHEIKATGQKKRLIEAEVLRAYLREDFSSAMQRAGHSGH